MLYFGSLREIPLRRFVEVRFVNNAAVCLCAALAACSDSAGDSTYTLIGMSGAPLPVELDGGDDCIHMLVSGIIRITPHDAFRSSLDVEKSCPPRAIERGLISANGQIRDLGGDSVVFIADTGAETGRGRLTADSLKVRGLTDELIFIRTM
jgi:hypothetical protein